MSKKFFLEIPEEVLHDLPINLDKPFSLTVDNDKINLTQSKSPTAIQAISLRWFIIPTLIASVIFALFFWQQKITQIPLTGTISISSFVLLLGLIFGMICFTAFFIKEKRHEQSATAKNIYWRNFPTILLSFAMALAFVIMVFFWTLGIVFRAATFDLWTATTLFALFTAIINYAMINFALALSPRLILQVLIAVIVGGVGFSMITNSSLHWWKLNFSFLGTAEAKNAWQFNLTLMISALLMIALVDYLFVALQKYQAKTWRLNTLRILLTLTAVNLGLVGFFPNNGLGRLHELHNQAANFLVYMIILLIIGIYWLLPNVTREFLGVSYGIAAVLILGDILFQVFHYLSLTAFEMIAFALAFSWIILLLQNLLKLMEHPKTFEIQLKSINKEE
ncbi:hypothetical protein [Enterococcus timonensis]|uniref:hypothetical protein n=1 Tax=Enterococcus timonensis TaxID=1852364 RepID=UPI0008D947FE|nr:hypothetical protein [Enterococcus timonensis]